MSLNYQGIRRHETDVSDDYGKAYYVQNGFFRRDGEIERRPGIGKSTMATLDSPIYNMCAGWFDEPYLITFSNNSATTIPEINSTRDPTIWWTDAALKPPIVAIGTPAAPVITAVTPAPASPRAYVAGVVVFTPTITYDGLSGALSYAWAFSAGPPAPTPSSGVADTYTTDFTAGSTPGTYSFDLTVTTALNGFSDTFPFTFVVT